MNTIENPLILKKVTMYEYSTNKNGDATGEYISKKLAQEMLVALEKCYEIIKKFQELPDEIESAESITIKCLILKVKG